jgi:hypothetical protein
MSAEPSTRTVTLRIWRGCYLAGLGCHIAHLGRPGETEHNEALNVGIC